MSNNFIQNIFSVKNIEKHKVITILWLKFKIKRKEPDDFTFVLIKENGKKVYNPKIPGLTVELVGGGARHGLVELHEPLPKFENCLVQLYTWANAKVVIKKSKYKIKNLTVWRMHSNCELLIGEDFSCEGVEIPLQCEPDLKVVIGDDCQFSHDVVLQPSDSHSIIDKDTKKVLNRGGDIIIGNHVWFCPYSRVHKSCSVPDNCVIATNSFVIKSLTESNTVNAGIPAKPVKKNVIWSRYNPGDLGEYAYDKI